MDQPHLYFLKPLNLLLGKTNTQNVHSEHSTRNYMLKMNALTLKYVCLMLEFKISEFA